MTLRWFLLLLCFSTLPCFMPVHGEQAFSLYWHSYVQQPENLLLSSDGHIKIADFGSVKPMNDSRITVLPNAASGTLLMRASRMFMLVICVFHCPGCCWVLLYSFCGLFRWQSLHFCGNCCICPPRGPKFFACNVWVRGFLFAVIGRTMHWNRIRNQ